MLERQDKTPEINPERAPLKREAPDFFKPHKDLNLLEKSTGFHGGRFTRRKGYRLALGSWLASTIDALILLAMSCFFLVMFSVMMRTSLANLLQGLWSQQNQLLFFVEVYAVSSWLYLISLRSLMGFSIGEWACDLRLGQPHERLRSSYVLRVALRSTLILLTGVVVLPLMSLLFGKDIPGVLSGLRLFSLK